MTQRAYSLDDPSIEGEIIDAGNRRPGDPGWIKIRLADGSVRTLRQGQFDLVPTDGEA